MADALLSALVSTILGNLNSVVLQEFGISSGLQSELENLESTLSTIQAVLRDAEAKQRKSEAIENWLRKLKDAAYDADNVLDDFTTEALRRKVDIERGLTTTTQVSSFLSLRNPFIFRFKTGQRVKNIREKLDAIAAERIKYHLIEGTNDVEIDQMESRKTSSLVNESEIYGRHEEKEKIVEILLNDLSDDHDGLAVHAICGMGGLGKTTLAQLVYNDGRVHKHFELRIWVCVSDDFDILRLTRAIVESIEGGICNVENLDPMQRRLQEKLSRKRFLLVLDDVWNEYHEKWDGLKEALRCGAKGSTVIVTTRIQNVALIMATHPTHHIGYLSEDDSWSLFKQRAFGVGRREGSLQFETLGKAIVEKCGGVPLAIKALGSLMRFKSTETEWLSVKDSEIWDLSDNGSAILPALRLSYDNLPPHLRQCFAFCCIFPKDCEMEKDLLIQLWMANGFIPSRGHMELHDLGHEIFNDLVWRSFLQDGKENFRGDVTCKMHDLMHDLAQSIMRHECCFIVDPSKALKLSVKIRHLYFNYESSFVTVPWKVDLCKVQSLRSLVLDFLGVRDSWDIFSAVVSKQNYLRVLSCRIMEQLPMSMSHLKHLRYLDFSYSSIKTLPESTTCLQNLQTLKLQQCLELRELPRGMEYMRNLRYLDIRRCYSLICTPPRLGKLTCLQTLSIFIVGQESGHSIGELKRLNLGGELSIKELDNVKNLAVASSANLKGKHNLVWLNLFWRYSKEDNNIPDKVEEVLDGLKPHPNLTKLGIESYKGSKFPDWLMGLTLQNLFEVSLAQCDRVETLPPLGKLPFLEVLSLSGMNTVKYFNNECFEDGWNSFPALKSLKIQLMPNLEDWKTAGRGKGFSCLLDLQIHGCPKLMELPWLPTVKGLSFSCSDMLLRSVTNLTSLTSLTLKHFEGLNIPSGMLQNLKALETLYIVDPNLKTVPNELDNLSSLKSLSFQACINLESLPEGLENFNSLDSLDLSQCDSLTSLPVNGLRGLSSLRRLCIQNCKKLESLSEGVRYLTALQDLAIGNCPEMKSLPDDIQRLTALQRLSISYIDGLYSLPSWLGSLPSLAHLEISRCQNLTSLPNGLQGSTLKVLRIGGCPVLEKRCKKERGTDWPKIAHIPTIYINYQKIQSFNF